MCEIYLYESCESSASCINLYCIKFIAPYVAMLKMLEHINKICYRNYCHAAIKSHIPCRLINVPAALVAYVCLVATYI